MVDRCLGPIVATNGQRAGTRLVGFSLWRSPEGEIFVKGSNPGTPWP